MRIYTNLKEAVKETERELVEMGIHLHPETMQDKDVKQDKDFETIELQGYSYCITSQVKIDEDFNELGGIKEYVWLELNDRVSESWLNPGRSFRARQEIWEPFLEKNGRFSYSYNERMREQIEQIILELSLRPNTRQAVITMYDRHQDIANLGGIRRVPCSMYYQLMRRTRNKKEGLDLIYTMRSCDFYTHYLYDVVLAMKFQEYMSNRLGIEPGHFTHFIGSLHGYKKDYEKRGVF
jgi:thymidylate synthase